MSRRWLPVYHLQTVRPLRTKAKEALVLKYWHTSRAKESLLLTKRSRYPAKKTTHLRHLWPYFLACFWLALATYWSLIVVTYTFILHTLADGINGPLSPRTSTAAQPQNCCTLTMIVCTVLEIMMEVICGTSNQTPRPLFYF